MIKNTPSTSDKKENLCELSVIGIPIQEGFKVILENVCQNYYTSYFYDISTYVNEFHEGFKHITNTIELHNNMNENYKSNEYKTDNEEFYNNVKFLEKSDEFLTISRCFLKYIANAFVTFSLGTANVVDISRCEENMELLLTSLGYKEKSKIRKTGEFIKYKNESVVVFLCNVEKIVVCSDDNQPSEATNQINVGASGNSGTTISQALPKKLPMMIEIAGYCYETDKENMMNLIQSIQKQLMGYFVFEGDVKKI
jgi:hypothetical protein